MTWRRSSFCADGTCLEIAADDARIHVRDSKDVGLPILSFDQADWMRFVSEVRNGRFENS
ncbi:DUF397 domain-containing protein [Actinoplanes sp. NPDC026619]|uniref:DUF397 domain-containing protein n=1 Tax=Actinoplanes sp. NPDC026619 TaxID=3155798 RepID=UPI0034077D89